MFDMKELLKVLLNMDELPIIAVIIFIVIFVAVDIYKKCKNESKQNSNVSEEKNANLKNQEK